MANPFTPFINRRSIDISNNILGIRNGSKTENTPTYLLKAVRILGFLLYFDKIISCLLTHNSKRLQDVTVPGLMATLPNPPLPGPMNTNYIIAGEIGLRK